MDDQHLTPSVIKEELDRYVIGQDEAKKQLPLHCVIDGEGLI